MRHGVVNLGGGLFHLLGDTDAFGAGFAGGRQKAYGGFHDKRIGGGGAPIGARHIACHDDDQARDDCGDAAGKQHHGGKGKQRVNAQKPEHTCTNSGKPEQCDDESGGNHPAATMPGVLDVFRRLLPDQKIPAGRAS